MKKRALAGTLAIMACGGGTATTAAAEDWPGYRNGAEQNRLATSDPGADVGTLWTSELRDSDGCVAVRDGRVYATARSEADPAFSRLSRLSAATGAVEWTTPPFRNGTGTGCPAVDGARVYVSRGLDVAAYDVSDGALAWSWDEAAPSSPPAVAGVETRAAARRGTGRVRPVAARS